jgi:hypothetical protein
MWHAASSIGGSKDWCHEGGSVCSMQRFYKYLHATEHHFACCAKMKRAVRSLASSRGTCHALNYYETEAAEEVKSLGLYSQQLNFFSPCE